MSDTETTSPTVAIRNLMAQFKAGVPDMEALGDALLTGRISAKEYAEAVDGLNNKESVAIQGTKAFSTVMSSWNNAFAASADLAAGNINELVDLYNAQINMIRAQNVYTQGLALQSVATEVYGRNSEEATRAIVAANYVGALYKQSKVNEMVAANAYATASLSNAAKIMSAFMEIATTVDTLVVALTALRVAQVQAVAMTEAQTVANEEEAATAASAATATGAAGAMVGLTDIEAAAPEIMTLAGLMAIGQKGGYVSQTGPYMLHAGETVVPAGEEYSMKAISPTYKELGLGAAPLSSNVRAGGVAGSPFSPNVEIHIHATSNVDLARVRMEVENALAKILLASQKQRGVY